MLRMPVNAVSAGRRARLAQNGRGASQHNQTHWSRCRRWGKTGVSSSDCRPGACRTALSSGRTTNPSKGRSRWKGWAEGGAVGWLWQQGFTGCFGCAGAGLSGPCSSSQQQQLFAWLAAATLLGRFPCGQRPGREQHHPGGRASTRQQGTSRVRKSTFPISAILGELGREDQAPEPRRCRRDATELRDRPAVTGTRPGRGSRASSGRQESIASRQGR